MQGSSDVTAHESPKITDEAKLTAIINDKMRGMLCKSGHYIQTVAPKTGKNERNQRFCKNEGGKQQQQLVTK